MSFRKTLGVVALLAALHGGACAAVDMNGPWLTGIELAGVGFFTCPMTFTQAGTSLSFQGPCFPFDAGGGTIDPSTGAFTLVLSDSTFLCPGAVVTGSAALDGRTFDADLSCIFDVHMSGSRCGNGVLDAEEQCDDGNRADGDCCSAACTFVAEGAVCDAENPCAQSACDGAGTCVANPVNGPCDDGNVCTVGDTCVDGACRTETLPDGASCDDGNGCTLSDACYDGTCYGSEPVVCGGCATCDPIEGCVPGREPFCGAADRGSLRVHDDVRDLRDRLQSRLEVSGVDPLAFGDPRTTTSWDVCVFPEYGFGEPLAALRVPAGGTCGGRPCWRPTARGYRYRDGSAANDGVKSLTLQGGATGGLDVRGGGPGLELGTLPAVFPLVVQVKGSDGQCWEAPFFDADVNGPTELRARD